MNKKHPMETDFFIIDSENLDQCTSAFYGYVISDDVITDYPPAEYMDLSGHGCYVVVTKTEDEIIISQDYIGCYGIYVFKDKNGGFVVGNSFLYLVEYLNKKGEKLTFNRDYANYYITTSVCSSAYDQTMINEIHILDRSTRLHINISNKNYYEETIDYKENLVDPGTREGIELLDSWFDSWIGILRSIGSRTTNIRADLSGGFDSRVAFSLVYNSGLNMNKIWVCSTRDGKHTHAEDLRIASEIAEELHFPLNNHKYQLDEREPYDMKEFLSKSLYVKLYFHKHMYYHQGYFKQTSYHVTGFGGGCVRKFLKMQPELFIEEQKKRAFRYSYGDDTRLTESVEAILKDGLNKTREKLVKNGISFSEEELLRYHNRETRCRNHFGRNTVENYLSNRIVLSPLLDPKLHRLKVNSTLCEDPDFLVALIFSRYAPELLGFEFEGGREISRETILKADAVNLRFPFRKRDMERVEFCPSDKKSAKAKPDMISMSRIEEIVQGAFENSYVKECIRWEFSKKAYEAAEGRINTENQHIPLAEVYGMIGIPKLLQDMERLDTEAALMPDWIIQLYNMNQFSKTKWNSDSVPSNLKESFRKFQIRHFNNVHDGIELCWEIISGATGYAVYRKNRGSIEKLAELNRNVCRFIDCEVKKSWGKVFDYYVCPCYKNFQKPMDDGKTIQRLNGVFITDIQKTGSSDFIVHVSCDNKSNKLMGYTLECASSLSDLENQKNSFFTVQVSGRDNTTIKAEPQQKADTWYFRARGYSAYTNSKSKETTTSFGEYSPIVTAGKNGIEGVTKTPAGVSLKRKLLRFIKK